VIEIRDADYRKFPRRPFRVRVEIDDLIRNRRLKATAVDLNPMGIAVESKAFNMGETVSLRCPSPEGNYHLHINGQVVRIEERDGKRVVGIEFFDMEEWVFEELRTFAYTDRAKQPLVLVLTDAILAR
jgi:hypothetical protein